MIELITTFLRLFDNPLIFLSVGIPLLLSIGTIVVKALND